MGSTTASSKWTETYTISAVSRAGKGDFRPQIQSPKKTIPSPIVVMRTPSADGSPVDVAEAVTPYMTKPPTNWRMDNARIHPLPLPALVAGPPPEYLTADATGGVDSGGGVSAIGVKLET
jgi:hypothetical protein